jgi:hypothetical protein
LNVVNVGVSRDQGLTVRNWKIELADYVDVIIHGFLVTNVDQNPAVIVEDQIDVASKNLSSLEIQFDNAREDGTAWNHGVKGLNLGKTRASATRVCQSRRLPPIPKAMQPVAVGA